MSGKDDQNETELTEEQLQDATGSIRNEDTRLASFRVGMTAYHSRFDHQIAFRIREIRPAFYSLECIQGKPSGLLPGRKCFAKVSGIERAFLEE